MGQQSTSVGVKLFCFVALWLAACDPRFNLFGDAAVDSNQPDVNPLDANPDANGGCQPTQVLCEGQCVHRNLCHTNLCEPSCGAGEHCYDGVCVTDECSSPSDCALADNATGMTCTLGRCLVTGCVATQVPSEGLNFCVAQGEVRQIAVGAHHVCAMVPFWEQAQVLCWGDNTYGQLGRDPSSLPNSASGIQAAYGDITEIAVGDYHSCAKYSDGWRCWGRNDNGQLGDGTTTGRSEPTPIATDVSFAHLAAGENFTCGLTDAAGEVYCWGNNNQSQIGSGRLLAIIPTPFQVVGAMSGNVELAAGGTTVCAVQGAANEVRCWGGNPYGGAGTETQGPVTAPSRVTASLGGIADRISVGPTQTIMRFLQYGDPGPGSIEPHFAWFGESHLAPGAAQLTAVDLDFMVANLTVERVSVGRNMSCAITSLGTRCWGTNPVGLGDGLTTSADVAVRVDSEARRFVEVDVGHDFACARGLTGGAYCWGVNNHGELGNVTGAVSAVPIPVL